MEDSGIDSGDAITKAASGSISAAIDANDGVGRADKFYTASDSSFESSNGSNASPQRQQAAPCSTKGPGGAGSNPCEALQKGLELRLSKRSSLSKGGPASCSQAAGSQSEHHQQSHHQQSHHQQSHHQQSHHQQSHHQQSHHQQNRLGLLMPIQRLPIPGVGKEHQPLVEWDTDESEEDLVNFFPLSNGLGAPLAPPAAAAANAGAPAKKRAELAARGRRRLSDNFSIDEYDDDEEEDEEEEEDLHLVAPEPVFRRFGCCGASSCSLM